MKSIALASFALIAGLAGSACAAASNRSPSEASAVKAAFGNTIVETYPDGRKAELWLEPNGAYTGEGRRHDKSDGRWNVKSGQLCFKQSHPFAFGIGYCTPIPKVGLDEPWQAKAVTGEAITVKVEPGHVVPS
jgi:hypothetical protein